MLFRFSFLKVDGSIFSRDLEFKYLDGAKAYVRSYLFKWSSLESITLHQYLTDDSCGPIQFIGTFILEDGLCVNRETKEPIF